MKRTAKIAGFTLLELLVVVGLVAGLAFFMLKGLQGRGAPALQSAQVTLANLIAAARTKAMASGHNARVLIHNDPRSPAAAQKYLRYLVLQTFNGTTWDTHADAYLPSGTALLPRDLTVPAGLVNTELAWTRPSDGGELRSTALRSASEFVASVNSAVAEEWTALAFAPAGTTNNVNALVIGLARTVPPAEMAEGASPLQFVHPESVCGLMLSGYGVTVFVSNRQGF